MTGFSQRPTAEYLNAVEHSLFFIRNQGWREKPVPLVGECGEALVHLAVWKFIYIYMHTHTQISETRNLSAVTTDILQLRYVFSLSVFFFNFFFQYKVTQSRWQGLKSHACLLLKRLPLGVQRLQQAICVNRGSLVMTVEKKKQNKRTVFFQRQVPSFPPERRTFLANIQ